MRYVALNMVLPEYFGVSLVSIIHLMLYSHPHLYATLIRRKTEESTTIV